ncbi:subtilase-type protease inhibitor [Streptomyces sp. NBC_00536]|uniref:SSI family serine proteinase inhibitor n=1 Tax=Streptomyces sp. NBC_00536 TaxID=2975769 RepID=UPI002E8136C0|nr:SSI family serine proteinase inhibitor [Streptomyces sp. NBC_00536]WUC80205.1 subtilase-type protease inhibitor [Streptomyces sp. NBC_00536]
MLRLAAFAVTTSALAAAASGPLPPLPLGLLASPDRLTVSVSSSGNPRADGEYRLECGTPPSGTHPQAAKACERLDELAEQHKDPFAPVSKRQLCTQQYGGPATARVTGTWHGHEVNARFERTNGCEIDRWKQLEPLLPSARS